MRYTKEDLQKGFYFIKVDNPILRIFLKQEYSIDMGSSPIEKATFFNIGNQPGWMDDDGKYYRGERYIEVFPDELIFINLTYEIY